MITCYAHLLVDTETVAVAHWLEQFTCVLVHGVIPSGTHCLHVSDSATRKKLNQTIKIRAPDKH